MGTFLLYTQILYTTLSLSLSLNLEKSKSQEKTFILVDCPNYYMFWQFESVYNCSKGIHVFLCYHVVHVVLCRSTTNLLLSHFLFSFYSPYVILLRIVLLIPKNITRETGVADYYNIILLRLKPIGPYSSIVEGKEV